MKDNMKDDLNLLDDLAEEDIIEEVVRLDTDNDPIRKIASILEMQKPDFYIDELERIDFPAMSLAYYFTKSLDKDTVNHMITEDPENIFQNILAFDEQDKQDRNSLISRLIPGDSSVHILKEYQDKTRRVAEQGNTEAVPHILQYTDIDIFTSIAAQKLLESIPLLASQIEKINNPDDLKDVISYSQLISSAKDKRLQRRLAEQAEDKDKNVKEILEKGLKTFFSEYPHYFSMLDSIREGKKINQTSAKKALTELFGSNMRKYEQAVYLSELIDEPSIIRSLFPKLIMYGGLKKDQIAHTLSQPDFAALFNDIITEYNKQKGIKRGEKINQFRNTQKEDYKDNAQVRVKKGSKHFEKYKGQLGKIGSCECNSYSELEVKWEKGTKACFNIKDLETAVLMDNDLDDYMPEKLNYLGYENLCMEFIIECENTKEKRRNGFKKGDKVEVFGSRNTYGSTRDGSWGYVEKVNHNKIQIEFHHVTGREVHTPHTFTIAKNHVTIIEPKNKRKDKTKSFEEIKKELENKSKVGEYIRKDYKLQLISKKIDMIYG